MILLYFSYENAQLSKWGTAKLHNQLRVESMPEAQAAADEGSDEVEGQL